MLTKNPRPLPRPESVPPVLAKSCSPAGIVPRSLVLSLVAASCDYCGSSHPIINIFCRGDEELDTLIRATIAGGGVIPHIHKSLIGKKEQSQKST